MLRAAEAGLELAPAETLSADAAPDRASIVFEGVSKVFQGRRGEADVPALHDISLEIPSGGIYGVIGRSGAGKSTLLRLVNGLETPSSGRVVVEGAEIARLEPSALREARREIGMIFQHFNLLSSRTAYDNIALPLELAGLGRAEIKARVEPLLDLVELADKRNRYPSELSGGQKQRVAIARALATEPKILLSDEATSALDPETTRSILRLLARINKQLGLTVLLITHEMAVVREICHRVAVLENGRLIEHGDVADVFAEPREDETRTLVAAAIGSELPDWLKERLRPEPISGGSIVARIIFRGPDATAPILSQLSRDLGVDVAILSGRIDALRDAPFGVLTVAIPGGVGFDRVRSFLLRHELSIEVLGHVAADL